MDILKVHGHMKTIDKAEGRGQRLTTELRDFRSKVQFAPTLDRPDARVLARSTEEMAGPVWEVYVGVTDMLTGATGELSVLVSGEDSDGDLVNSRSVLYPAGSWFKAETYITTVPNPWYVDPDKPEDTEAAEPAPDDDYPANG